MDSMIDLEFVIDTQRQLAKTYRSDMERHQTTRFSIPIPGLYKYSIFIIFWHFFAHRHFSSGPSFRSSNFPVTPGWFQTRFCCVFVILGRLQKMLFSDCFKVKYQHDSIAYKTYITVRFYVLTMTCYCTKYKLFHHSTHVTCMSKFFQTIIVPFHFWCCNAKGFTHQVCLNAWLSTVSIRIGFCKSIRCLLIHYPSSRHSNQRKKSNHQSSSSSEKQITRRWQPAPWYCQRTPWHNTLNCLPTSPIVCTLTIRTSGFWVVKIYPPWILPVCSWKPMKTGCIRKGKLYHFSGASC